MPHKNYFWLMLISTSVNYYIYDDGYITHTINRTGQEMANTGVKNGKNITTKPAKPKKLQTVNEWLEAHPGKKLSKAGIWRLTHPEGIGLVIYDMRAVMK
jgi:hypothetical protein